MTVQEIETLLNKSLDTNCTGYKLSDKILFMEDTLKQQNDKIEQQNDKIKKIADDTSKIRWDYVQRSLIEKYRIFLSINHDAIFKDYILSIGDKSMFYFLILILILI